MCPFFKYVCALVCIAFIGTGHVLPANQAEELNQRAAALQGNYPDSSIRLANKALLLAKKYKSPKDEIEAYKQLGEAYQNLSEFKTSISCYLRGIKTAEKNNLSGKKASLYNGMAIDFYYMGDYEKALEYMRKSAAIKIADNDVSSYATIVANIGGVFHALGKNDSAMNALKKAEVLLLQSNSNKKLKAQALASLYNSMGSIQQVGLKQLDSAAYYYSLSLTLAKQHTMAFHEATALHNLGGVYNDQKNFTKAISCLLQSLQLSKEIKRNSLTLGIYRTLSEAYEGSGNYQLAYQYKTKQLNLRDSIFQEEKQQAVHRMEIQFRTAKKDQQILQQKAKIEKDRVLAQQNKNRFNLIIFIAIVLLLIAAFIAFYFWQRKNAEENLEKEKSKIYQNIVHEIRTPLTLINGPLQTIKAKVADGSLDEDFAFIERNSGKLVTLVNELLDASKLENKQFTVNYQFGDISAFVRDTVDAFRHEASKKGIRLTNPAVEFSSPMEFPANVIEKIVGNLVSNAVKYSYPGGEVIVECTYDKNNIHIAVSDNGPGISESDQKKIFNRFYRSEKHKHMAGTGIGLSLVKELTQLVQGEISLKSVLEKGTRIDVHIPLKQQPPKPVVTEINDDLPCVLIVEDDKDVSAFTAGVLKDSFTVITASNGKEGLQRCLEFIPDMVLTDVMMPEMDGIQMISEIKKSEITTHIPVIIFSAKASVESRITGLQSGADGYLPKPFNPDELKLLANNLWRTLQKNRKEYEAGLQRDIPFRERLKGDNAYLAKIIDQIILHIENPEYSVNELSDDMCISRSQLHRNIKSITGQSTTQLIKTVRIEKAKDMLKSHAGNITEIAYACGFSSQSYFTRTFTEYVGVPPTVFQK